MSVLDPTSSQPSSATNASQPDTFEMDDTLVGNEEEALQRPHGKGLFGGVARHTLGLILLLCVVFLWTISNFLGSSIFADDSYAKPFFLTYLNTSFFTICVIPRLTSTAYRQRQNGTFQEHVRSTFTLRAIKSFFTKDGAQDYLPVNEDESFLKPDGSRKPTTGSSAGSEEYLDLRSTARYSLAFCMLWFMANYFAMACLQYTTVASTTILTSTSSIWTLLLGTITRTEKFTWKKLCGVLASLAGIALISQVDINKPSTADPGTTKRAIDDFPDKSPYELALGDSLALLSAVIYGFYTIILKKTTVAAHPKSIHMPTFFGFVGLFNVVLLFPLFPILHFTGLEPFVAPPTAHIWMILLVNSVSSLLSDICWAYAMVFTSPLVVTVGLSLTIPFSLIGEMIIQGRFESWVYWVGAMIVVGSFVFVEREEKHEEGVMADGGVAGHEDFGEPGPAILIEDYDEVLEEMERERRGRTSMDSLGSLAGGEGDDDPGRGEEGASPLLRRQ